jgi:hypothetical protein
MGITAFEVKLMDRVLKNYPQLKTVCELGSQNLYLEANQDKPPFASDWYRARGLDYKCIDLAGDNHALQLDLSVPFKNFDQYDIITDFGTSEHVVQSNSVTLTAFHDGHIHSVYPDDVSHERICLGFYSCWLNKHKMLRTGGLMFNVNPKTGNWPGHGYTYYTTQFYEQLAGLAGYKIVELGEHPAMGNTENGWNVYCVLQKQEDKPFPDLEAFMKLQLYRQ